MMSQRDPSNWISCTGDVVVGDTIRWEEAVFTKSRNPSLLGHRFVCAEVIKDSYGARKQQHTFTVIVLESDGYDAIPAGTKTTRKGRTIYRNGTVRLPWDDEAKRLYALDEKYKRGYMARQARSERIEYKEIWG